MGKRRGRVGRKSRMARMERRERVGKDEEKSGWKNK